MDAAEPDDLLVERRDQRRLLALARARPGSCERPSHRRRGRGSSISSTSAAASAGLASRSFGLGFGFGAAARLRRGLLGLGLAGSLSLAACAPWSACACAAAPRRRATRPSPSRRGCGDNRSTSSGFAVGPLASIPNTALPRASVSPTLPKRRLPGVRTRERTSLRPRLRAVSASASRRSSLTACPSTCRIEPDQPADQRAVDADILEVAADRRFEPVGDRARVPAAHRLRHQLDDRAAVARRHADRRAARELVDRGADPRGPSPASPPIDFSTSPSLPASTASGLRAALDDRLAALLPQRVEPQADRLVVEQLLLDRLDPLARFGPRLEVVGELGERFLDLEPDRVRGIGRHLDRQLPQAVDDRVGELGVEPGELQHPVGLLVHHLADQLLVGVERARHPADRRLEHRHVAVLVDRRGERVAEQRRRPPSCAAAVEIAPLTIPPSRSSSRLSKMSAISREAPARMRVAFAGRRLEEAAGRAGDVDALHPPRDDRRDQEILLEEVGERFADAVLVARDDRGVRDRQAERMAEQRGDREPVGEAADHRRLGERLHVGEPGIVRLERARDDEHRRHRPPAGRSRRPSCPARPAARG